MAGQIRGHRIGLFHLFLGGTKLRQEAGKWHVDVPLGSALGSCIRTSARITAKGSLCARSLLPNISQESGGLAVHKQKAWLSGSMSMMVVFSYHGYCMMYHQNASK